MRYSQKLAEKFNLSGKISQSYLGEDIMLWRYFKERNIRNGFFIDIGAYHPKFFNNTWRLRKKLGFKGINIEPNGIELFQKYRKNDINLETVVGEHPGTVAFHYVTSEPAVSGKDQNKMVCHADTITMGQQLTLTQIVHNYNVTKIDLLDIDIEGTEMEVLRGYDWKIMPRLILIEDDKDKEGEIHKFIIDKGYHLIAHTFNNALYEI